MSLPRASVILLLFGSSFAINCLSKCGQVWSQGEKKVHGEFQIYVNNSEFNQMHKTVWRWRDDSGQGIWEAFAYDSPHKGSTSGGFTYHLGNGKKSAYLHWKLLKAKRLLTWTSDNKQIPFESWNLTLCESKTRVSFETFKNRWIYHLGTVKIGVGESGRTHIDEDLVKSHSSHSKHKSMSRQKREDPSAERIDESGVWNKLKGYFKELFDNGPNDQRGWMTRITDWLLGFLERILS